MPESSVKVEFSGDRGEFFRLVRNGAALELINASSITALFVVEAGRPVGIIHIHDLLRAGVA